MLRLGYTLQACQCGSSVPKILLQERFVKQQLWRGKQRAANLLRSRIFYDVSPPHFSSKRFSFIVIELIANELVINSCIYPFVFNSALDMG